MATLRVKTPGNVFKGVGLTDWVQDAFEIGVTEPLMTNTGVPSGTTLTDYDADIVTPRTVTVGINNTTFYRVRFGNIRMDVRAYNVSFIQCEWEVTENRSNTAMVRTDQAPFAANCLVSECTINNTDQMGYGFNAIQGHDITVERSKIMGTVDGIRPNIGGNVKIRGNFIGFLGWWGNDATHGPALNSGNQTHSDCIQTTYGGVEIIGNSLWAYPSTVVGTGTPGNGTDAGNPTGWYTQAESNARRNALLTTWTNASQSADGVSHQIGGQLKPLMCNVASGPTNLNLVVRYNWFAGGGLHVDALATNLTTSLGTFEYNRHYNDGFYKAAGKTMAYRLAVGLGATIPLSGAAVNTYMDGSGTAIIVQ